MGTRGMCRWFKEVCAGLFCGQLGYTGNFTSRVLFPVLKGLRLIKKRIWKKKNWEAKWSSIITLWKTALATETANQMLRGVPACPCFLCSSFSASSRMHVVMASGGLGLTARLSGRCIQAAVSMATSRSSLFLVLLQGLDVTGFSDFPWKLQLIHSHQCFRNPG